MLTEGRVRAIAAQVASAIAAKIKPSVSEEQIRSDVEAVLRAMKEAGELEGGTVTDEQISAAVEKYLTEHPIESPEVEKAAESARKSAEEAEASVGEARTAADEAGESASNAERCATAAAESASQAASSAEAADSSASAAQTAKEGAETAKNEAAQQATNAGNAAQEAATAATGAAEAKTAAQTAQQAAEKAKSGAEQAATNASSSAGTAGESATTARNAAQSAVSAKEAAETAQTAAEGARDEADQQATTAANAAQTATSKATEAAEANAAAQTAKGEAQTAATNAGKSATAASESAANAEASEEAAATSESNAAKSATAATGSATTANNAATAAQTAQGKAEAAQAATEAAKAEFEQKLANGDYKGDPYTLTPADKAEIVQAVIESLGGQPVAGYFDEDNNIVLTSALADGDYTIKYEMGDNTYTLGTVTVKTTPNKYTVTFVADGVTVATVEYEEGATSITEPAVPVKDGYTGVWETYTLNNVNITVNAVYTENAPTVTTYGVTLNGTNCTSNGASSVNEGAAYTAKLTPSNGKNMIYTASVKMGGADITGSAYDSATNTVNIAKVTGDVEITARAIKNLLPLAVDVDGNDYVGSHANGGDGWEYGIRVNSAGAEVALDGLYCTGFMPCELSSWIYIKNISEYTKDDSRNRIQFYNESRQAPSGTTGTTLLQANTSISYSNGVYKIKPAAFVATAKYFRFACGSITANTIVTVDEEL